MSFSDPFRTIIPKKTYQKNYINDWRPLKQVMPTKSPEIDPKTPPILTLPQALALAEKLSTDEWREAEGLLDFDINPYKHHVKKLDLYRAFYLLTELLTSEREARKASEAAWKAYKLNPKGYEIMRMLERGGCYSAPKSAKEIEELISYQQKIEEFCRPVAEAEY